MSTCSSERRGRNYQVVVRRGFVVFSSRIRILVNPLLMIILTGINVHSEVKHWLEMS